MAVGTGAIAPSPYFVNPKNSRVLNTMKYKSVYSNKAKIYS